ncbi:MAG: sugar transferase [Candidatus Gracilibacteria bacterium]|nr:sugar transferase [Candidatus Gracilibacteria bacterium]MDD5179090.1 sugar transferase [Candidatus Gracilibacteria bacterium]
MKHSEILFGALRLPVDFVAAAAAFFAAKEIRLNPNWLASYQSPASSFEFTGFEHFVFGAAAGLVIIFALNGLYNMRNRIGFAKEFQKIIFLTAAWLMLIVAFFFFRREFFFSRLAIAYAGILAIIFLTTGRLLIRFLQKTFWKFGFGVVNVIVVGTNPNSTLIAESLKKNSRYRFLGFLEVSSVKTKTAQVIGSLVDFEKIVKEKKIGEIILASRNLPNPKMREILSFCRVNHLDFCFVPDLLEVPQRNVELETIHGIPLIGLRPTPLTGWGRVWKRVFDIVVGIFALVITSPIWILTTLLIKLDSRGPILFTRKDDGSKVVRIGKHGKPLWFIKFRSMKAKSDSLRYSKELAEKNTRAGSPLVKIENDPRITRIGKFIRKYSIDELPQILSVLGGSMSLVGPRPHLPEEVAKYKPHHHRLLTIKPGITGLAQVNGRSDLDFEEEYALDAWYIENWSIWLDLKILVKTIGVVLFPSHQE